MRRTVAKVSHHGIYRVIYDDTALIKPYTIYYEHHDNGFHSKKVESYADLGGCMYHLAEVVIRS